MHFRKKSTVAVISLVAILFLGQPVLTHGEEQGQTILASRIIDHEFHSADQALNGEVDDIIIKRRGRVKKLTVEFGGFLDIGDKLVAISFNHFRFENGKIILEATEKQLNNKKNFDYYEHGLLPGYYYQGRPYPGGFPPRKRYSYTPYPEHHVDLYRLAFSPSRYLASLVMDRRLIDEDGQEIGQVKDLLMDIKKKTVTKIILASVRLLGENVYVAIPYKPLGFAEQGLVYKKLPGSLKDYIYPYKKTASE